MILEYKVNEFQIQPSWLKTIYDLIEDLECKCKTHVEESYNPTQKCFARTRVIEVSGTDSMLNGLKFRMDRFFRSISLLADSAVIAELH